MVKTYLYIPEELNDKITYAAKIAKKSKAALIREVLEKGIRVVGNDGSASANVLLELAKIGEKCTFHGPKDSSQRIDELLWGIKRKK